jgi:Carboxypeptidase regulatory-like domain
MAETKSFLALCAIVTLGQALAGVIGCGDGDVMPVAAEPTVAAERTVEQKATIRGRVTDLGGSPLAGVEVVAAGVKVKTDANGRFELGVAAEKEVRVAVESERYSASALPVTVSKEAAANIELTVKSRSVAMLPDAEKGGRIEGSDGFAVELPEGALRDASGMPVKGEVELRYALVTSADDVTAAPGRMQASDKKGLEGFGMAEVRFYKRGERLTLGKEMTVEVPLHRDHQLKDGDTVDLFEHGREDLRWQASQRASVQGNKAVLRSSRDEWLGAAREQPTDSCVSGRLSAGEDGSAQVANTTIRAARERGLSLIQVETAADGSFCVPVTPDDDWRVSTYFDDGAEAFGLEVALDSAQAAGMCGGSGCKQLGNVALPRLQ